MRKDQIWLIRPPVSCFPYQEWLLDRGSLTARIKERCRDFSVRKIRQEPAKLATDERRILGLRAQRLALVREVLLYCGETPVVFAHSALDARFLHGPWRSVATMGNKPLGAALFADARVKRMPLHFKKLTKHHALYARACRTVKRPPPFLWARRSLFRRGDAPLLVTEVFLPGILKL
ncbi:MAG: chorismate--pyruvate lyase family protein [Burkholderiales bacterium]